ncbi:MFS transporter [Psychrosphaera sp. 1_MG-2023]|uniref:MFS transporter n=1 Tax=Psychrosphaera sp. 1_MG-2023 TaxID=3062643 RepID=UPI0026E47C40|nr:MFS transporter [Psychrosphaera sp. 1_MG-2023]MDO6719670.1 MFS transporter [Psychrosphaera sp. 1_MG-2023]
MTQSVSFKTVKRFPLLMWILLFGSFITRGSFYMVWPFLAVILFEKFQLSATRIGLILSSAAVVSVLVSFVVSSLSDRIGRRPMMYATGVLYIISFSLLAEANTVNGFVIVITLCSIATALWRPLTSALIGDVIGDSGVRELAMQSLYFAVNVGCAIGPIVGVWLGLTGQQSSFYFTTYAFGFLLVLLFLGFRHFDRQAKIDTLDPIEDMVQVQFDTRQTVTNNESKNDKPKSGLKYVLRILGQDKLLQYLILANVLCMFIYGQMDSSLIQYLTREKVTDLLELVSSMIFTNAMVIITCQFILLKMMSKQSLIRRVQIGLLLLAISQLWFALNPVTMFWGWIAAVIIMSLAEAILFPTMNVHIDRIAPAHLRGAYFGAASFYDFGFAFAPLGGGIILDYFGGPILFLGCGLLALFIIYLYHVLEHMSGPDVKTEAKSTGQR